MLSLAEKLGYASPGRMLAEMTGRQLQEWRAYYLIQAEESRARAIDQKGKRALARHVNR